MEKVVEGLPLAREVLGNADGVIPDSIGQERSFLDNGGGAQNEGLQENPYAPKHGIAAEEKQQNGVCPRKTPLMHLLLKMEEGGHNQMMGAKVVALRDTE